MLLFKSVCVASVFSTSCRLNIGENRSLAFKQIIWNPTDFIIKDQYQGKIAAIIISVHPVICVSMTLNSLTA